MDPNLLTSETGKILVRDNAIVFSVEHVRVIITAEMIIIPRDGFDKNSANVRFISLLQSHIEEAAQVRRGRNSRCIELLYHEACALLRACPASAGLSCSTALAAARPIPGKAPVWSLAIAWQPLGVHSALL